MSRPYDDADSEQEREQYEKDQLPKLSAVCKNCGQQYGDHHSLHDNCPRERRYRGLHAGFHIDQFFEAVGNEWNTQAGTDFGEY